MAEFQELIERLNDPNPNLRELAEAEFRSMGQDAAEQLLQYLEYLRAWPKRALRGVAVSYLVWLVLILSYIWYLQWLGETSGVPWLLGFGSVFAGLYSGYISWKENRRQSVAALALLDDPRLVGGLMDAIPDAGPADQYVIAAALERQLSNLRSGFLTTEHLEAVNRALLTVNPLLAIALLKALTEIGDSAALPYVARLRDGEGVAGKDREVRRLAKQCHDALMKLVEQNQASQRLLRASSEEASEPALLRPSQGKIAAQRSSAR